MSPFTVYLIMQADALGVLVGVVFFFGMVFLIYLWFIRVMDDDESTSDSVKRLCRNLAVVVTTAGILMVTVPSSKALAVIYVLPQLTSEPAQAEMREVYDLAKEALRELSKEDKE